MCQDAQDVLGNSNSNSENLEEKLVSLKEIGNNLEEELGHIQDIEGKLVAEHENIGSIVGHVKKIQLEIENTKQLLVKCQAKEDKKERCNRDLTPQKLFEEFREKFKENRADEETNLFIKPTKLSIIVGILLVTFFIFCLSMKFKDKIPQINDCLYLSITVFALVAWFFASIFSTTEAIIGNKGLNTTLLNILVYLLLIFIISVVIIYNVQQNSISLFNTILNNFSWGKSLCFIIAMILLIVLDFMHNLYKLSLTKEKKQAVLSIKQVLYEEKITITTDVIRTLMTLRDEIGSDLITEFNNSIIKTIFLSLSAVSVFFGVIQKFIADLKFPEYLKSINDLELQEWLYASMSFFWVFCCVFLAGFIFHQYHVAVHDKDLYIEALKDMEFKEVLEQSKKGR